MLMLQAMFQSVPEDAGRAGKHRMKIKQVHLKNFMQFEDATIKWSPHVNVICGENSTGKTTLLKCLYSLSKPYGRKDLTHLTKEQMESAFVDKMTGVFRPDEMRIGRLVSRRQGNERACVSLTMEKGNALSMSFGTRSERHAELDIQWKPDWKPFDAIYLPPKEMISATEHFQSLYEEYHLDFEETYYDLTKLLDKPLKRGANTNEQNQVLSSFESILQGNIVQKNKKFYLKIPGQGEFEMGLVSEGYRKLATIIYLIASGSLTQDSILFWDEPETNLNPKMIQPVVNAIMALAKMGVQVFVTTHDYFVQQSFNMLSAYPESNPDKLKIQFLSLYKEEERLAFEQADNVGDLRHNAIMEEFDALYDREQRLIYGYQ